MKTRMETAQQFIKFVEDPSMNIIQTLAALHAAGFEADLTNGVMDDFADKFNTSPLEYNDNLNENRGDLIKGINLLIADYENKVIPGKEQI